MPDEVLLSTAMLDPRHRNDFWCELVRPLWQVDRGLDQDRLDGWIHSFAIGGLLIGKTALSAQSYVRGGLDIAQSGLDQYFVHLLTSGSARADFDGVCVDARPGDIYLIDLSRPYRCLAESGTRLTLLVPRKSIDLANGGRSAHGLVLRGDRPAARLLHGYLADLHGMARELDEADSRMMETATVDLIVRLLEHQFAQRGAASASSSRMRKDILDYIDAHISDPELGPAMLERQFQISRAHLYRVFVGEGGIAKVIRDRRLDIAYRMLRDPSARQGKITDIALELGFSGHNQFTRTFNRRFGLTPSEARAAIGGDRPLASSPLHTHFIAQHRILSQG